MQTLIQDLRYGVRMMLKKPGLTLVAIITLGLGIGANTTIFSIVNSVLLNPLPFEAANRLVWVWDSNPSIGYPRFSSTYANFRDWQQRAECFEQMAAFNGWSFNLTGEGEPERLQGAMASANLFPMLGINPVQGRTFSPDDDQHVALISDSFWRRRYGGDPSMLNRSLILNGESYAVIGIIPADLRTLYKADVWTPIASDVMRSGRGSHFINVIARLKPGSSLARAQVEMNSITAALEQQFPDSNTGWNTALQPLHERIVGSVKTALWILFGAVILVQLIVCANLANLLTARAASRQKEVAIRTALGAGRGRLARQFLSESLLLALAGGGLGLLLAAWGADVLVPLIPLEFPRTEEIGMDGRVLGFTLFVSLATGIVFGLVPALQASKVGLGEILKESSLAVSSGPRRNRIRGFLVVSEIALAMILLIGAGLMLKSLFRLTAVDLGFNPENLQTLHISLPQSGYSDRGRQVAFTDELLRRVGNLPGVEAVATISPLPLVGGDSVNEFFIEGGPPSAVNQGHHTNLHRCSSDYFRAMEVPLLKGRFFDERETLKSEPVVLINQTLAQRFWPDDEPLGKRVSFSGPSGPWLTIVGVVGDVRHMKLDADAGLEMYQCYSQSPIPYLALVTRVDPHPATLANSIRQEILTLDSNLPVYGSRPMKQIIAQSLAPRRFQMLLLGSFAALALLLASIGIYGVMSYSVTQRTHEIGIRIALGATATDVTKLVVAEGMRLIVIGLGIGLAAAYGLTRVLAGLLYEVSTTDPSTFFLISTLLVIVGLIACFLPAQRAIKVDPLVAIKYE